MAKPMVVTPPCAACGIPSARIELVAPGHFPAEWEQWPSTVRASIVRQREPGQWYLLFKGVAAYTARATPSTLAGPGRSPRRSGLPCASLRYTRPGSTTMQDSARTAMCPTATTTGRCPRAAMATAPAAKETRGGPWSLTRCAMLPQHLHRICIRPAHRRVQMS